MLMSQMDCSEGRPAQSNQSKKTAAPPGRNQLSAAAATAAQTPVTKPGEGQSRTLTPSRNASVNRKHNIDNSLDAFDDGADDDFDFDMSAIQVRVLSPPKSERELGSSSAHLKNLQARDSVGSTSAPKTSQGTSRIQQSTNSTSRNLSSEQSRLKTTHPTAMSANTSLQRNPGKRIKLEDTRTESGGVADSVFASPQQTKPATVPIKTFKDSPKTPVRAVMPFKVAESGSSHQQAAEHVKGTI